MAPICPFSIRRSPDHQSMSQAAAAAIIDVVRRTPDALLILPTGNSPLRTYQLLVQHHLAQPDLFQHVQLLKLDEWGGLDMDDPATCESYLQQHLVTPLGIPPDRYISFQSNPADPDAECARIGEWLSDNGPADIALLGLGLNGHLGLNEPADSLQLWPHRATLTPESQAHSMLRSARSRPAFGLTIGMGDLLNANHVFLLVSGESKRPQLARLLTPDITPRFPASMLWLNRNVTLFCDTAALPDLPPTLPHPAPPPPAGL